MMYFEPVARSFSFNEPISVSFSKHTVAAVLVGAA